MKKILLVILSILLVSVSSLAQTNVKTKDFPHASPYPLQDGDNVVIDRANTTLLGSWSNAVADFVKSVASVTAGILGVANGGTGSSFLGNVRGLPSNQWTALYAFGDASSYNEQLIPYTNGYVFLLANQMGIGPKYFVLNDFSHFDCDIVDQEIIPNITPNDMNNPILVWLPLPQEPAFGAGTYQAHLTDDNMCHMAALTWSTLSVTNKVLGSSFTQTGSWTADTHYPNITAITTTTNGDTATSNITTYGGPIYVWFKMRSNDGGTFAVSVDGGATTTVATQGQNQFTFRGGAGCLQNCFTMGAIRLPGISAGTHSVNVAVTSSTSANNSVTIEGIGTSPMKPYTPKSPAIVFGGQIPHPTYPTASAAFDAANKALAAQLVGDGLTVPFANVAAYYNAATDLSTFFGNTLINDSGQLHIMQAFSGILQPVRSADGSIDPRDFGAACNTQYFGSEFYSPVASTFTLTFGSPTVSLTNGVGAQSFSPTTATQSGGGAIGKRVCIFGAGNFRSKDVGPCTSIASIPAGNASFNMSQNSAFTISYPTDQQTAMIMGGYDGHGDSTALNLAGNAAILNGGKVHLPTNCMGFGAWPVNNVTYYGDNAGPYYGAPNGSFTNLGPISSAKPPLATVFWCESTGYSSDQPLCADVSNAPRAKFESFTVAGIIYPYPGWGGAVNGNTGNGVTLTGIGYAQSSGNLGPGGGVSTKNMSYFQLIVGEGEAMGYNIKTDFTGSISGNTLTVLSMTSTNMLQTYGLNQPDMLALGRTITGVGVPVGEKITSVPSTGWTGSYGVSIAATVGSESMSTVQLQNGMEVHDDHSQAYATAFMLNGDFTDSEVDGSICTGTFASYCWYLGPASGANFGNGSNRWYLGRAEEIAKSAFTVDGGGLILGNVEMQFDGGYNIQTKGSNSVVQYNGGFMYAGGHCNSANQDKAMVSLGGTNPSVDISGVATEPLDFGSGCASGGNSYLFSTATGSSGVRASVEGGNSNQTSKLTNLYNWTNGTPASYKQDTAGWPKIDTSVALTATSTGFSIGAMTGGALYATTSATGTGATGIVTLTLPAVGANWNCSGGDQTNHTSFALGPTTSTSAALYATSTVSSGDVLSVSCPNGL